MINPNRDIKQKLIVYLGYDPYQIKKEELSGDIRKFLPVQWHSLLHIIGNYFLFSSIPTD